MNRKFLIIVFAVFFIINCAKNNPKKNKDVLTIGIRNEPENLMPLFPLNNISRDINTVIFNHLLAINEDLQTFSPELARSYQFGKDSLTITFHLRTDVYWHDGKKFNARDVAFTYRLQTNEKVAWDGISFKQNIDTVRALNDSTVQFEFSKKTPFMIMDAVEGVILPKHLLESIPPAKLFNSAFAHSPVGTGPYQIHDWIPQQYIVMKKNAQYFKPGKPNFSTLLFKIIPEPYVLTRQLLTGEIDIINDMPPETINNSIEQDSIVTLSYSGKDYDFIGWNLVDEQSFRQYRDSIPKAPGKIIPKIAPHPLFGDRAVRKALSLAMDKQKICQQMDCGLLDPINAPHILFRDFATQQTAGFPERNFRRAQKLLMEQGWKDEDGDGILEKKGQKFVFTMYTNAGNNFRKQILMILEQEFRKLKIKMIPKIVEANYLVSDIIPNKKFDAVLIGWNAGIKPDFTALFHSSQYLHPFHLTGYYSGEFDRQNDLLLNAGNINEYQSHLSQTINILTHDQPYTWLFARKKVFLYHQRVKNVKVSILSTMKYVEDFKF